jgi:hypothetical protein
MNVQRDSGDMRTVPGSTTPSAGATSQSDATIRLSANKSEHMIV